MSAVPGTLARLLNRRAEPLPAERPLGTVALTARGVGYRVDGRWLVRGVDLELTTGRVVVVIGPNGAGKSTLLSLLAGDLVPGEGEIVVDGLDVGRAHPVDLARRRAVVPQRPVLSFPFSVGEVVAMGRAAWAGTVHEDDDERAVAEAIDATGLAPLAARDYPSLSGGEQAIATFARVLAQQAGVLLLDEPTAALDLRHQEQLMTLARRCAREGRAVLVVLHDIQLAAAYADEVAVVAGGRLAAQGPPGEVLTEELLAEVYGLPVEVIRHRERGDLIVLPRGRPAVAEVTAGPAEHRPAPASPHRPASASPQRSAAASPPHIDKS